MIKFINNKLSGFQIIITKEVSINRFVEQHIKYIENILNDKTEISYCFICDEKIDYKFGREHLVEHINEAKDFIKQMNNQYENYEYLQIHPTDTISFKLPDEKELKKIIPKDFSFGDEGVMVGPVWFDEIFGKKKK